MKKVFMIVVLAGLSFTSCKKDRSCTCTGSNANSSTRVGGVIKNVTKSKAKTECQKLGDAVGAPNCIVD
jgi:hypothetical protein